ncbi:MAG TPA: hypothetical protein H9850_06625 [Candidatus Anaerobiospirillum pullistercoris]|uniref:Uncharacterized protein n=1 Tax=Candidatus Anaerobiospirillum pullistercoris TaxID=2838452 RepID=A0A9D2B1L7_9GAMM|nr:hypothetical protein [Candidatus Anaerobiospirillum pullistercoris]
MEKQPSKQQDSKILWKDPSCIDHYFTEFLTLEQIFFMWFLSVSPFWGFDQKCLETPVGRLPSLLNTICSVIESISRDINFYLDKQFNPAFYINKKQIDSNDVRLFQARDFYSFTHDYLRNNNNNIPALNNFSSELNDNKLLVNNLDVNTSTNSEGITNQVFCGQVKESRMHYDFDYLAHIDFRLGVSSKKIQLRTDIIPIDLTKYPSIQTPLKHAHESEYSLAKKGKGEHRPMWCKVYQYTKHALADHYQECNGLVVLEALGALYILCMFAKYLPKTKMTESPDAPIVGSYPLEDLSNRSLLFKPTMTRTTFRNLANDLSNQNLVEFNKLSETMFIIKDSEKYFDIMLNNQLSNNQQLADQLKTQHGIVDLLSNLPSSVFEESGLQPTVVLNTYCHYEIKDIERKEGKVFYKKPMIIESIYNYRDLNKLRPKKWRIKK